MAEKKDAIVKDGQIKEVLVEKFEKGNVYLTDNERTYLLNKMKTNLEQGELIEVTTEYREFEPGQEESFIYLGLSQISTDTGKQDAIKALNVDGKLIMNANAMLVSNVSQFPAGTQFHVVCTGKQKAKGGTGSYFTFKISVVQ